MPAHPETPEPLKTAMESMEAQVQSTKSSLMFAAPEIVDLHWGNLQMSLAETMAGLYNNLTEDADGWEPT